MKVKVLIGSSTISRDIIIFGNAKSHAFVVKESKDKSHYQLWCYKKDNNRIDFTTGIYNSKFFEDSEGMLYCYFFTLKIYLYIDGMRATLYTQVDTDLAKDGMLDPRDSKFNKTTPATKLDDSKKLGEDKIDF